MPPRFPVHSRANASGSGAEVLVFRWLAVAKHTSIVAGDGSLPVKILILLNLRLIDLLSSVLAAFVLFYESARVTVPFLRLLVHVEPPCRYCRRFIVEGSHSDLLLRLQRWRLAELLMTGFADRGRYVRGIRSLVWTRHFGTKHRPLVHFSLMRRRVSFVLVVTSRQSRLSGKRASSDARAFIATPRRGVLKFVLSLLEAA